MGVYEFQGQAFDVKLGDVDGNGVVNVVDFLTLLRTWGAYAEECRVEDLDMDGIVGDTDVLMLLDNWD